MEGSIFTFSAIKKEVCDIKKRSICLSEDQLIMVQEERD